MYLIQMVQNNVTLQKPKKKKKKKNNNNNKNKGNK